MHGSGLAMRENHASSLRDEQRKGEKRMDKKAPWGQVENVRGLLCALCGEEHLQRRTQTGMLWCTECGAKYIGFDDLKRIRNGLETKLVTEDEVREMMVLVRNSKKVVYEQTEK